MAARIGSYRTYRFLDKSPAIDAVRTMLADEGIKPSQCKALSGVTVVPNWVFGDTRDPKDASLTALSSALGYVRQDYFDGKGKVQVGFKKARDMDYVAEREKQADWILRTGTAKQKAEIKRRRAKANGQ